MNALVRQEQLIDVVFSVPNGMELLRAPWAYYRFLGVPSCASNEEISGAFKRLSPRLHPDKNGGNIVPFQALNDIVSILLDDGSELGHNLSRRMHYDLASSLDFNCDRFLEYGGQRTRKLSDVVLAYLNDGRKEAKIAAIKNKKVSEYSALEKELETAGSKEERKRVLGQMQEAAADLKNLEETRPHIDNDIKQAREEYQNRQRQLIDEFHSSPQRYFGKTLDLLHIGDNNITFGTNRDYVPLKIEVFKDSAYFLNLDITGESYISGFKRVHVKTLNAEVAIEDTDLEGVFQAFRGSISLRWDSTAHGIIRARSLEEISYLGFVQRGDLYVPRSLASGNWWERKPQLDLATKNGTISLVVLI